MRQTFGFEVWRLVGGSNPSIPFKNLGRHGGSRMICPLALRRTLLTLGELINTHTKFRLLVGAETYPDLVLSG